MGWCVLKRRKLPFYGDLRGFCRGCKWSSREGQKLPLGRFCRVPVGGKFRPGDAQVGSRTCRNLGANRLKRRKPERPNPEGLR
jgi:hypothetical protein